MDIHVYKFMRPCAICGKEYEDQAINGHICFPNICNDCIRGIVEKWKKENEHGPT